LVGSEESFEFLAYEDDRRPEPQSIHYLFVGAHAAVLQAKKNPEQIGLAERKVQRLNFAVSNYAYEVTTLFMNRASALRLLKPTSTETDQEQRRKTPIY
jgi:hypothetical protein